MKIHERGFQFVSPSLQISVAGVVSLIIYPVIMIFKLMPTIHAVGLAARPRTARRLQREQEQCGSHCGKWSHLAHDHDHTDRQRCYSLFFFFFFRGAILVESLDTFRKTVPRWSALGVARLQLSTTARQVTSAIPMAVSQDILHGSQPNYFSLLPLLFSDWWLNYFLWNLFTGQRLADKD